MPYEPACIAGGAVWPDPTRRRRTPRQGGGAMNHERFERLLLPGLAPPSGAPAGAGVAALRRAFHRGLVAGGPVGAGCLVVGRLSSGPLRRCSAAGIAPVDFGPAGGGW